MMSFDEPDLRGVVVGGRYRLDEPIGTGGMATVWKATHLTLNRCVAVKFVGRASINQRTRDRFLREARVAAAVHHRNVVDILDFGTTDDGIPYMAMELLVGQTLAARMDQGPPMSVGEALSVVARLLSGLDAVHEVGIVHRDLKPENVFLCRDRDGVFPKLLDFGVSRAFEKSGRLKSVYPTTDNAIVGTPQYMSPEQARGLKDLDHRADLWSAGVILFELLTGMLPFDSDIIGDVLILVATSDPPDFAKLRPDLAGPLDKLIKRAMTRNRSRRYQSAREMRADLLNAAARLAARSHQASTTPPTRRRSRPPSTSDAVPRFRPQELIDALGDAYEPGDSGLLDFSQAGIVIERMKEAKDARSGERPSPPVTEEIEPDEDLAKISAEMEGELVFDGLDALQTLTDGQPPAFLPARVPARPAPQRSPWLLFGLASGFVAAMTVVLAVAVLASSAPPEPTARPAAAALPPAVEVQLNGFPEGGTLRVDGRPRPEGQPVLLPRADVVHVLEVIDEHGRRYAVAHNGLRDGAYDVAFDELPVPAPPAPEDALEIGQSSQRRSRRSARTPRRSERPPALLRNPGF